jgi:Fic family protein
MIFEPRFTLTPELVSVFQESGLRRQQLLLAVLNPRAELEWQFTSSVEATHYSTAIEGNPLSLEEVRRLLSSQPIQKPRQPEIEVRNYKAALDWLRRTWTGQTQAILPETIFHLQALIMLDLELPARLGKWRVDPVFVFDAKTNEPVHEGDPADEVPARMAALCQWLNTTNEHPLTRAAIAHLEFVRIHPFMDGNGRTARLLETLLLAQHGWDVRGLIALEPYYRINLNRYYDLIASSIARKDFTAWIVFVAEAMRQRLIQLEQHLQTKTAPPETPLLNERQLRILALLDHPNAVISNADAQKLSGASHMTAARDLAYLVQIGLLEKHGAGRSTRYQRKLST